jgi:hypothetical protein
MLRCRYSKYGLRWLRRPQREGEFLGLVRDRPAVKVRWDGNKTYYVYHRDFIEVETVCEVDVSRVPILRELLGIRQ